MYRSRSYPRLVALAGRVNDRVGVQVEEVASVELVVHDAAALGLELRHHFANVLDNKLVLGHRFIHKESPTGPGVRGPTHAHVLVPAQPQVAVLARRIALRVRTRGVGFTKGRQQRVLVGTADAAQVWVAFAAARKARARLGAAPPVAPAAAEEYLAVFVDAGAELGAEPPIVVARTVCVVARPYVGTRRDAKTRETVRLPPSPTLLIDYHVRGGDDISLLGLDF
jgi:hypothetical protein